ncbi:Hsp20/alpha crystallin family protein [Flavisericum labens]|uniref:Hsp20/alpha crystallin family protein n=1 Tax=Flavisericum labens TaxID=3377112 RepID=UPI00387B23CE
MKTLTKHRKRNRLSPFENQLPTPWNTNILKPWGSRLFNSRLNKLMEFDDIFNDDFLEEDSMMPAMNIQEHEKDFVIEFAAPSFNKSDFEVFIKDDVLHVCAQKETEEEEENENGYSRKEFNYQSFEKSIVLPPTVDLNQELKAVYKNGVLKLKLLKKEESLEKETPKKVIEVE